MPELILPQWEPRLKRLVRRVFVFLVRKPRYRLSQVQERPIVSVADVCGPQVLKVAQLDSSRFLVIAHRHPGLLKILQKLEVEIPLRTSEPALQVFRDRKVWEIAFCEAVETGSEFLELEHLFFGVLALEEMKGVLTRLNLKVEDIHETLKWVFKPPDEFGVSILEQLKSRARELEEERGVLITYPALLKIAELDPKNHIKLLVKATSEVLRSGQTLVSSKDV